MCVCRRTTQRVGCKNTGLTSPGYLQDSESTRVALRSLIRQRTLMSLANHPRPSVSVCVYVRVGVRVCA